MCAITLNAQELCRNDTLSVQIDNPNINDKTLSQSERDSLLSIIPTLLYNIGYRIRGLDRYKMYTTENVYNLLKLDTKTGRIEQVQWSLDTNKEFTMTINDTDLSWDTGCGTFELYPTQNMYQFILLDKVNGRCWHVQWGIGDNKRWIRRIY